jgi:Ca2+-transporting ATPase
MNAFQQTSWHELPAAQATRLLESDPILGLSDSEVELRLLRFGPNQMTARKRLSEWKRFLLQLHQPLIYILLAAAGITLALGEWVDASVISGVVFTNAVIGYLQECKAEKAIDALAKMVRTEATVLRGGEKFRICSSQLVPGDVVHLQSGDRVPADIRLLHERNLQIEEASLTGESSKAASPVSIVIVTLSIVLIPILARSSANRGQAIRTRRNSPARVARFTV